MPYDTQAYQDWSGNSSPYSQYNPQTYQGRDAYSWSNVGRDAVAGATVGATVGGAAGSVVPVLGNGVGAIVGGVVGGVAGAGYGVVTKYTSNTARSRSRAQANAASMEAAGAAANQAYAPTEYLGANDPTSQTYQMARERMSHGPQTAMSPGELAALSRQEDQGKQRAGFQQQINDYFGGADRAGWQQSIVSNRLNQDLANVKEDYGNNIKSSVQNTATQGLVGGSVDIERRGAVARTRDTGAIQAASNADAATAGFKNADQQAKGELTGLVNSQGIGDADSLRTALQNINNQTTQQGQQYASGQQQRQIDQFGRQNQSQAWGGGLNGLASSVRASSNGNPFQYNSTRQGGW